MRDDLFDRVMRQLGPMDVPPPWWWLRMVGTVPEQAVATHAARVRRRLLARVPRPSVRAALDAILYAPTHRGPPSTSIFVALQNANRGSGILGGG